MNTVSFIKRQLTKKIRWDMPVNMHNKIKKTKKSTIQSQTCAITAHHASTVTTTIVVIVTHKVRRSEDGERVRARPTPLLASQHRRCEQEKVYGMEIMLV